MTNYHVDILRVSKFKFKFIKILYIYIFFCLKFELESMLMSLLRIILWLQGRSLLKLLYCLCILKMFNTTKFKVDLKKDDTFHQNQSIFY